MVVTVWGFSTVLGVHYSMEGQKKFFKKISFLSFPNFASEAVHRACVMPAVSRLNPLVCCLGPQG